MNGHAARRPLVHVAVITRRNLLRFARLPQLLLFATVQPVMFLLLFNYVFGGAISASLPAAAGGNYINFLIPGILVQTTVFGAASTALGLTEDLGKGVIDRFRSLPIARSAVLAGRTAADVIRNLAVTSLMLSVGFLIGFRLQAGFGRFVAGVALAMTFSYAMTWVMAFIGLAAKTPEAAQSAGFLPIFPLVFASSVFLPTETMPTWLQAFAENQPITIIANTLRALFLGGEVTPLIWQSLAWVVAILAVFAPLAVRQYRRTVS